MITQNLTFVLTSDDLEKIESLRLPSERGAIYVFFGLEQIKKSSDTNILETLTYWLKKDQKIKYYYSIDEGQMLTFLIICMEPVETKREIIRPEYEESLSTLNFKQVNFSAYLDDSEESFKRKSIEVTRVLSNPEISDILDAWQQKFLRENQYTSTLSDRQKGQFRKIEFQINYALGYITE